MQLGAVDQVSQSRSCDVGVREALLDALGHIGLKGLLVAHIQHIGLGAQACGQIVVMHQIVHQDNHGLCQKDEPTGAQGLQHDALGPRQIRILSHHCLHQPDRGLCRRA